MTGTDEPAAQDGTELPPGALADLGEQLRVAASRRSTLLAGSGADPGDEQPDDEALDERVPVGADAPTPISGRGTRRGARRGPILLSAMAAAAAIVLVIAVSVLSSRDTPPASAGVHVDRSGETVTVRIDGEADLDEVVDALHDAGVVAAVEPQATGPSRVGRFTGLSTDASQGPPTDETDITDGSVLTFRGGDRVTIYVGVRAEPGQGYDAGTDGLAAGEPFHGLDEVIGMPWTQAGPILEQRAQEEGVELQHIGADDGAVSGVQMASGSRAIALG